jgi:hypothetical protein
MAARALRDNGVLPPGAENTAVFRDARGGYFVAHEGGSWQEAYAEQLARGWRSSLADVRAAE